MGCTSSTDTHSSINKPLLGVSKQSNIMEFDQLFLVISQYIREIETLKSGIIPARTNLINISKVHLLNKPKLSDAYTIWTWGVSVCNKGQALSKGVNFKISSENGFTYSLGMCDDLKLLWFAQIFNEYILAIQSMKQNFPLILVKWEEKYDKIKMMRDSIKGYTKHLESQEENAAIQKVDQNLVQIQRAMQQFKEFQHQVQLFDLELTELQLIHESLKEDCDKYGKKIYNDLDVVEIEGKCRLRTKINNIVLLFWPGNKRTNEEEQYYYKIKLARSKERPKQQRLEEYKNKHIFPTKLRWTGCQSIDLKIGEFSLILEELNQHLREIKKYRNQIRLGTQSYLLNYDHISESWRIFCWAIGKEIDIVKQRKLILLDQLVPMEGLVNIRFQNKNLENLQGQFINYFKLVRPSKCRNMQLEWEKFKGQSELCIKEWSLGQFRKYKCFKQIHPHNQYNVMSNLIKTIYALQQYMPICIEIYEKKYLKLLKEGLEFYELANEIINQSQNQLEMANKLNLDQLTILVHQGEKISQERAEKKKSKLLSSIK